MSDSTQAAAGAAAGAAPAIEIRGLKKSYGDFTAIPSLDLTVEEGEFLSLLGPSGCGKSTLLRMIAGFVSQDEGRILVRGQDVTDLPPERRPSNMVFQRYALFPHMTVAENVGYGLKLKGWDRKRIAARVAEMLELVSLPNAGRKMTNEISGGQAQRVALARALAPAPSVLLLDEPLSALDRAVRADLQKQLARIHAETGTTFLYVTHDQEEAMSLSTRIALMEAGEIVQLGAPAELYRRPKGGFAARFIGDINILTCTPDAGAAPIAHWEGLTFGLDAEPKSGAGTVECVFRPEDLVLYAGDRVGAGGAIDAADPAGPSLPVETVDSTYHGFYWVHRVRVERTDHLLTVREMARDSIVTASGRLRVRFPAAGVHRID
ncbi:MULTISPECIES: ABC transporter ATP-binding protein [unclassified Pseudarthrobacter]|uniref:ABC transporter ATP-binding protein n=1 Tax=unclassified Pseudarthrobacter TaxID=2647000 RepID=UPI0030781958